MKKGYRFLCTSISASMMLIGVVGCSTKKADTTNTIAFNEASTSHYDVVKRSDQAIIDGVIEEKVYADINAISGGFHFPWEHKEAPFTSFKGYSDGTNFYFNFEVKDEDILVDEDWKKDESTVDNEDRVELFFAGGSINKPSTDGMKLYYGIEIDSKGRVHDYSIEYYRHFDGTWNLEGLETKATTTETGYVVEGKIPLKSLQDLDLIHNNMMRVGIYRAEFSKNANAKEPKMEWISWVDPKTEAPDFHVDSSFGEFYFLD
ncbi:MAG: sugar-binding protein [Bacilli bacterium]|nr:sugar-binding protein [Bacilli bacterium]